MNSYRVYKPNKQGNGSASEWQLSFKKQEQYFPWKLFFSIAAQSGIDSNGNARFNWENAIRVKMEISDIAEIVAVLEGKQSQAGASGKLYHQNGSSNKVISFNSNTNTNNYFIKVSHQTQQGVTALQQSLTIAEGCVLRILLEQAVIKLANWGTRNYRKKQTSNSQQNSYNTTTPTQPPTDPVPAQYTHPPQFQQTG